MEVEDQILVCQLKVVYQEFGLTLCRHPSLSFNAPSCSYECFTFTFGPNRV